MCPQLPRLSPEYSHKAGLQTVITGMPLQIRPVTQRRPREALYDGPDRTWASELDEAALWDALRLQSSSGAVHAKGVPACFVSVSSAAEYMKQLGFSEGYELLYAIAFGYPDEMPAAKPREVSKVKFVD